MTAKIYGSKNGNYVGTVENFDEARYENACQTTEGHCRADDVLDDDDIKRLGLSGETSIYALVA